MIVTGLSISNGCNIHGYSSEKRGCRCLQAWGLTQSSWACTGFSMQQTLSCSPDASGAMSASGTAFLGLWDAPHPSVSVLPSAMGLNCSPEEKASLPLCHSVVPPKGLNGVCGVLQFSLYPAPQLEGKMCLLLPQDGIQEAAVCCVV